MDQAEVNPRIYDVVLSVDVDANAPSSATRRRTYSTDEVQKENMGVPDLEKYMPGSYPAEADEFSWSYLRRGMLEDDTLFRISISNVRIIVCSVYDNYPTNNLTIQSSPFKFVQSVDMERKRLLPFNGYISFLKFVVHRCWDWVCSIGIYGILFCAFFLFIILWKQPDTLDGTGIANYSTKYNVNSAFAFGFFLLLFSISSCCFVRKQKMDIIWMISLGLFLLLAIAQFIVLAYMVNRSNSTPNDNFGGFSSLTYGDKLSCQCNNGGTGTSSDFGGPDGYTFFCGYTDICALDNSSCGFCADEYYGAFATSLVIACISLLAAIVLTFFFYRIGGADVKKANRKEYVTYVTIHGSSDYGYPLKVCLNLEQALQVQNKIYNTIQNDASRLEKSSINLKSSNVEPVAKRIVVSIHHTITNFLLDLVGAYA